jgi:hypothetical protein
MRLVAVFATTAALLLIALLLIQTPPSPVAPSHTHTAPPKPGTQIFTQQAGEKTDTQTPTAPRSQTAGAAVAPPPGWRIVVEAERYVEHPAKICRQGWRETFYLWNGTLYYEENHTYARTVGRVVSYYPKNETVKKIIGTNPTQYILYNVTWYPLYSYQPQVNTTPVKFRTYVAITRHEESYAYRVEGQLPVSQIMWAVYLSFYNLTDRAPLNITIQKVKLDITETKTIPLDGVSMSCIGTTCTLSPKIEIIEK